MNTILAQVSDPTFLNQVFKSIQDIAHNTNDWYGFGNIITSFVAITAGVCTWVAVYPLFQIRNEQTRSKSFQTAVMDDLIRHFFVNSCILKAIQQQAGKRDFELDFLKLEVLSEDLNLNRFTISPVQYRVLHQIELSMRNYGIHGQWAAKHCNEFTPEQLQTCCAELLERGDKIIAKLDSHKKNHLKAYRTFDEVIKDSYQKYITDPNAKASPELTEQIRLNFTKEKQDAWKKQDGAKTNSDSESKTVKGKSKKKPQ